MTTMYIRVKKDGFIYDYDEILAKNAGCEVITEQMAYPERFIPQHATERLEDLGLRVKRPRKTREAALDLTTADIPEPPDYTSPELAAEAARGMP